MRRILDFILGRPVDMIRDYATHGEAVRSLAGIISRIEEAR